MLDMYLNERERELVEKAREFGKEVFREKDVSHWLDDEGIPYDVAEKYRLSEFGYLGLPPELGGVDVSLLCQTSVLAELTKAAGTIVPFQSQILDLQIISKIATSEQTEMILDNYEKSSRVCFSTAISDATGGSDVSEYNTSVSKRGNRYFLNGEKTFVANGQFAPYIVVAAKDMTNDREESYGKISFWMLPASSEGTSIYTINKIGQKMIPFAAIKFNDVELLPEWRMGTPGDAANDFKSILHFGRCIVCGGSYGLAMAAYEDAVRHAGIRKIKGNPIGDFQQIGLLLTEMASSLVGIEAHIQKACWSIENESQPSAMVALMKKFVPAAANDVASKAMQVTGGAGYTDFNRVGRIWIDTRGGQFAVGTDQVMANVASRAILKGARIP